MDPASDQMLWAAIRNRTRAVSFSRYQQFVNRLLLQDEKQWLENPDRKGTPREQETPLEGEGTYRALKVATESILLLECGGRIEGANSVYTSSPRSEAGILDEPASFENGPRFVELIWSYWHEEGLLVQAMNAITRHLQDNRGPGEDDDPLSHLNVAPLRPLNDLLWGFIMDDVHRLSAKRRAYEYEHQYGLALSGKATRDASPGFRRSRFLEAFHNLLYLCSLFFKSDNDTAVVADGVPLLHTLKEVSVSLAQGANNQFGDVPWTARAEMMMQQWILARPEVHAFLESRETVPGPEAWMPQIDAVKRLQGWSDVPVTHFHDLAVCGEQILLSVRYSDWASSDQDAAANWARYWRPEVEGYVHSYRKVTGVDLTNP